MMDQHRAAVAESLLAIRPGEPGKSPFWNGHARQFIVAPAFDFKPVERAASYRFVLTFEDGTSWTSLGLKGDEKVTIRGLQGDLKPRQTLTAEIVSGDGSLQRVPLLCRIDTLDELEYYRNGGILHYVLRKLAA